MMSNLNDNVYVFVGWEKIMLNLIHNSTDFKRKLLI